MEEERYKQVFVGKKFDKFEKKVFSIPAFFFGGIYFAYRKMILHAIIVLLITGIIDTLALQIKFGLMVITIMCIHIAIGLFFPLWYRKFYNKKVKNILSKYTSEDDRMRAVQKDGGTSIGLIIVAIVVNTVIINSTNTLPAKLTASSQPTIPIINSTDTNISNSNDNDDTNDDNSENKKSKDENISQSNDDIIENAQITGYSSVMGKTSISVEIDNESISLSYDGNDYEFLKEAAQYDEISITLHCEDDKIISYELLNTETNELVEVETIAELRELLGYFNIGNYEEELTLKEIDSTPGFGSKNDTSYMYYECTFETKDGKELELKYNIYDGEENKSSELTKDKKYIVKFEVEEGIFDYDYIMTDFKEA